MRKLLISLSAITLLCCTTTATYAIYGDYEEFNNEITEEQIIPTIIPKGSYFRGLIGQTISSEFNNTDDFVKILITSDFILNDKIILPKNSVFVGQIKGLQKAQQGMDGVFSIDIIALASADGKQYPAKGYIVSKGTSRVFGGAFSKRTGHKTTLHRSECFGPKGVLQLQQNGPRSIGKETKIEMGDVVTIVLEEEIKLD